MKSPTGRTPRGPEHQGIPHRTPELAKLRAGVLEAGVSGLVTAELRGSASRLLIAELGDKSTRRNCLLGNLHRGVSSIHSEKLVQQYQTEIDVLLWIITCCGLIEIDEHAQRISAVPEDMRDTFSRVLSAR